MKILRETREKLGMRLTELARRLDIPHQRLSEYDRGRALPPPEVAARIQTVLKIAVPSSEDELSLRELGCLNSAKPYRLEHYSCAHWERALEHIEPPHFPGWLTQFVRCDSALEALAWLQWLNDGAEAGLLSPLRLGFCQHALVDSQGLGLGERPLPCLYHPARHLTLWPQVGLKTAAYVFRCDALCFDGAWNILEIDGEGHRSGQDEFRRRQLGLPEWRFSESQIKSFGLPILLQERQLKRRTGGP